MPNAALVAGRPSPGVVASAGAAARSRTAVNEVDLQMGRAPRAERRPAPPPLLPPHPVARWLLVIVLIAGAYFFRGFLVPVLAALIIGFASWPLYSRLVRAVGGNTTYAATIALLTIIAVLVLPIVIAISYAVEEARIWVQWLLEANRSGAPVPDWIEALPFLGDWLAGQWNDYLNRPHALGELVTITSGENIGNIYRLALAAGGQTFHFVLSMLFMLIALFFVYKDGLLLVAQLDRVGERILPTRWQTFSRVVPATISATVVGMGIIAIGEGIVLGFAYWIAGIPSPVFFGVITGIMALIPGGAPTAVMLGTLYLVGSGKLIAGVALLAWGSIELFIVDKTLRPHLVGGPIKLPFLATFFGLIGGVATLGLVGLFVGPVLMALLVAIWREWLRGPEDVPPAPV
jgi:predicted PurR-regulated permease PerM